MQSDEDLKMKVTSLSTADDVALLGQRLGYDFSGDDLLRFNGQKVEKVTVRKVDHPGEYH
ncbi:Nif11-like leader peptide family natural product precursor [Prochlorococcus sp. MIT 1304]